MARAKRNLGWRVPAQSEPGSLSTVRAWPFACLLLLGITHPAMAQDGAESQRPAVDFEGTVEAEGEAGESADTRLAFQGRLTAINVVLTNPSDDPTNQIPLASVGLRLLEGRLFAGAGFGFFGVEGANTGFSVSPLVSVDVVRDVDLGAFYVAGWFSLGSFDGPRLVGGGDNDLFAWGFTAVAGARAILTRALALGVEMGWGFLSLDQDGSNFMHGVTGNLMLEASLGL